MREGSGGHLRTLIQGSPRLAGRRAALAAWLLLAAGGCTSGLHTADGRFEAGDYEAATTAYESSLAAAGDAGESCGEPLFRLALSYSLPASSVHQPERAADLLDTLAVQCPESPWGHAARMLLDQRAERRRLKADLTVERARADALQTHLEQLTSVRAAIDEARQAEEQTEAELQREIDGLRRQVANLRGQVEERDRQLVELENELRRIKDIDLQ